MKRYFLGGSLGMEILSSNNYYLSNLYENNLSEEDKKALGIYYTPKYITEYMVKKKFR